MNETSINDRPRPIKPTHEMKIRAATVIFDKLLEASLVEEPEREESVESIAKYASPHDDGYGIAKQLERRGWDCNLEMAEVLDEYGLAVQEEIRLAEKIWFDETRPEPPFAIGARVRLKGWPGTETGIIDGIYDSGTGKFLIKIDGCAGSLRRIINFEDVELAA